MIKELYKLDVEPMVEKRKILLASTTATMAALGLFLWRGQLMPLGVAGLLLTLSFVKPEIAGRAFTWVLSLVAVLIHTANLILLTSAYFLIVTPMGFALRWRSKDVVVWRHEPTDIPTKDSFMRPY